MAASKLSSRRDFLLGYGGLGAIALLPPLRVKPAPIDFHLRPHYREQTPLEPVLAKRSAAADSSFPLENEHDQIAAVLESWSEDLRAGSKAIRVDFAADFEGSSFVSANETTLRSDSNLAVHRRRFSTAKLTNEQFLRQLRSYLDDLHTVLTAEFQVTGIRETEGILETDIAYAFVATGPGFHREQRCGTWDMRWTKASSKYELKRWSAGEETRSRTSSPFYADVTQHAIGSNASYVGQLAHGIDYWRTILDGASRIDIYGHNGVTLGDIDGDGLDDLYVCQPAGLPNRLYRNRGDGTFEDITESSGVGVLENTACALLADFANRGRQDLLVVRASGPLLFVNDGRGKFHPQPQAFQFENSPQGTFTGAAIADYDRDGWLDIYFCLYVYYQGSDQYRYPMPYYDANIGPPNFLFRNNPDGTFSDVTAASGLNKNNTRYSFCCGWNDYNRDGWPDLYVVNDFGRKNLYRNKGDGTFTDVTAESGTEDIGAGMSVCWFDYDNDTYEDLYVANMWTASGERVTTQSEFQKSSAPKVRSLYHKHAMGNSLLSNLGKGIFEDRTAQARVGMGRWSWSSDAWDFNHDGFPDLYVTNGMISGPAREDLNSFFWRQVVANSPNEAKPSQAYEQGWTAVNELVRADYSWSGFERNVFYANNRDGSFSDVSGAVGLDFIEDGRSFALADLDGDGRLEICLKNRNGPQLRILKNVVTQLPPSISFRLVGVKSNRDAIGAVITIETSAGRQTRTLQVGSGFLSQHTKELFFGLGQATGPIRAQILWPSGLVQKFDGISANLRIYVQEGDAAFRAEPYRPIPVPTAQPHRSDVLPEVFETWLLAPIACPSPTTPGKPALFHLSAPGSVKPDLKLLRGLEVKTLEVQNGDDLAAIYNLLFRSLYDRHRDLSLPTSLLVNGSGEIVKIYVGPLNATQVERDLHEIPNSDSERIAKALPFSGYGSTFDFGRNYLSLGSVYFQRGYFEQAGKWFQLAWRDDPKSAEAQYGLGSVYLKREDTANALVSFQRAVQLQAAYPDTTANAWNNLGLIAAKQGRTEEAIGYFQNALQLHPDHLVALENLGNAYRREKRWEDARRTLQHALAVGPNNPEVNYSLAMVFAQMESPDQAYTLLRKALEVRPNYPEAMNNLGVLYLRTRHRDEAVAEFEACIRVAPGYDQSYLNLSRVYLIEGDRERARQTLLALLKQYPDHAQAQQMLRETK